MLISGIPLPEKSEKECNLTFKTCGLSLKTKVIYQLIVKWLLHVRKESRRTQANDYPKL